MICDVSYNHKNYVPLPPKTTCMYDAFEDDVFVDNVELATGTEEAERTWTGVL